MDKHDLISALKELAISLGRTPTRAEFITQTRFTKHMVEKLFGDYSHLIEATGLVPTPFTKITNKIFEKDIEIHLNDFKPRKIKEHGPYPSIASISDIHWPFECKLVIARFLEYVGDEKPEHVIINGDAADFYCQTRFPRSHNIFTPKQEEDLFKEKNKQFWIDVQARSPKSKCVQMLGNHDVRPLKRTVEAIPTMEHWVTQYMKDLFTFPGVETIHDPRQEYMIEDIAVFHGYRSQLGAHRDYTHHNCINGHTHRGGVVFRNIGGQTLWELNSGLAGDPESKGLTYTPQKITDWTKGFGAVNRYGPQFVSVG